MDSRPWGMEQVLLLAEPCERFDGHCSHGEEKCDADDAR